jgi:Fe-S cluster biogenesis protein NfuA
MMTKIELKKSVEKALDEIRPYLLTDGGDIVLIGIENNEVMVQFLGACNGCKVNQMTLRNGVEATVKKYAPQIKRVVEVN